MSRQQGASDSTYGLARLLLVGGVACAIPLAFVSFPAAAMCLVVALIGRIIMERGRPTSRWARGWTAFRSGNGRGR